MVTGELGSVSASSDAGCFLPEHLGPFDPGNEAQNQRFAISCRFAGG